MSQEYRFQSALTNEEVKRLMRLRRQQFPYPRMIHAPFFPCWRCGCQDWGDVQNDPKRLGEPPSIKGQELWECSTCGARWNGPLSEMSITPFPGPTEDSEASE